MLVGAAALVPVVAALLVGLVDGGLLVTADLASGRVADDLARTAVVARTTEGHDAAILAEVRERTSGRRGVEVDRVVVFRADGPEDAPPPACTRGPAATAPQDDCSVYGAEDLVAPAADLTCRWCPEDRCLQDLIGVWVRLRYRPLLGVGPTVTLTEHAVYDPRQGR